MALIMVEKPQAEVISEPVQKVLVQPFGESAVEILTAEYIALYRKFLYFEVKDLVKRMDEIRKELQSIANETMDEKKPAIFACVEGEIEFSERGKVADVPAPLELLAHLMEKFGPAVAASVIDVGITQLRKILTEAELKHYLEEKPGGRTLRSVRPKTVT
jgi:antitoxin component HigA of HigAB toxin-antitoxin module